MPLPAEPAMAELALQQAEQTLALGAAPKVAKAAEAQVAEQVAAQVQQM